MRPVNPSSATVAKQIQIVRVACFAVNLWDKPGIWKFEIVIAHKYATVLILLVSLHATYMQVAYVTNETIDMKHVPGKLYELEGRIDQLMALRAYRPGS